jgi:hypothetical protein
VNESLDAGPASRVEQMLQAADHHLGRPARAIHHVRAAVDGARQRLRHHEVGHHQRPPEARQPGGVAARMDDRPDVDLAVGPQMFDERGADESGRSEHRDTHQRLSRGMVSAVICVSGTR